MSDLLELAVAAHGGLERWNRFRTLQAKMAIGGAIFDGIKVPTTRRVYAHDAQGQKIPEPLLVSIDIEGLSFS